MFILNYDIYDLNSHNLTTVTILRISMSILYNFLFVISKYRTIRMKN